MRDGSSCAQVMAMAAPLDWPMTANDEAPTASATPSTSRAWLRQPYVPAPVTSLRPRPRKSIATSCSVSPASRSARRSKPDRFADRPGTHTTAGASAAPHRRTRSRPDSSGTSESSYPTACCVISALSPARWSSEDSPAMSAERRPLRLAGDVPDATAARQLSARPPRMRTPPSRPPLWRRTSRHSRSPQSRRRRRGPSQCPPRRPSRSTAGAQPMDRSRPRFRFALELLAGNRRCACTCASVSWY